MQPSETPTTQAENSAANAPAQDARTFENVRSYIVGGLVGLVVVFLAWGGVTLATELTQKQIQKEYLSLTDDASRGAFARRHKNHPLGGLVLLGQANDYYNASDYAAAKAAYAEALGSGLKTQPVLLEQAMLGEAFSTYALDTQKGLEALRKLVQNTELMQSTRAHAASELAGFYAQKGDFKQAKDYLQLMRTLKNARPWQRQADALEEVYPQLKAK